MPMDEATRYGSAFAAAQAMGVTTLQLNDSAQFYLNVLKTEDAKFQESVNIQRQKQIGSKEKAIIDLDATIKAKGEQIAKLTQEIAVHQDDMGKMKAEISEAVVKIETTLNDFHATYSDLTTQIGQDVENMKKYLK
jgi:septal ring factor EnvC (AmiA/AmiB activator)